MSDFNSSLPVRTQSAGDVIAKISDATTPSQQLAVDVTGKITVKIDDASGSGLTSQVNGTQQALDVGINVSGVQIDPRNQGSAAATHASPWWVRLTDGTNDSSLLATGELKVSVTQLLTEDHNYGAVGASTLRVAAQIGNATGAASFGGGATSAQTLRTSANLSDGAGTALTSSLVNSKQRLDVGLAAEGVTGAAVPFDSVQIGGSDGTDLRTWSMFSSGIGKVGIFDSLGNAFSISNPLPVTVDTVIGSSVNDFKDASSIAASSSDNHDYTVTAGKTLTLDQIESAASGKAKMQVQIETGVATGVFNAKFTQFNSTATPSMSVKLSDPIQVAAGVRVRIVMTNLDVNAMDLYSTVSGTEN
jgi:hypothetical protein